MCSLVLLAVFGAVVVAATGSIPATPCGSCANTLSPEQLRLARIELIKHQILQKLGRQAPPRRHQQQPTLPLSQILGTSSSSAPTTASPSSSTSSLDLEDEFYGTTEHVVVMAQPVPCETKNTLYSTQCFGANFPQQLRGMVISAGELWVHTKTYPAQQSAFINHTLTLSELHTDRIPSGSYFKRVLTIREAPSHSNWYRFPVQSWISYNVRQAGRTILELSCKDCSPKLPIISNEEGLKPFFIIKTDSPRYSSRKKRSIECSEPASRCCREPFYLSFKEIGWDEWILEPKGYSANYCRGSCLSDVSITRYHHTTVLQRYIQSQELKNITLNLCCTPSKMSFLSLIYVDEDNTIFQKSLPNMVVEACDCA